MNLNLEFHFQPSRSFLKYQKEHGSAILPSEPGTTSPFQTPPRHSRLPAACPYLPLSAAVRRLLLSAGRASFHSLGSRARYSRHARVSRPRSYRQRARSAGGCPAAAAPLPEHPRHLRGLLYPLPQKRGSQQAAAEKTSANPAGKRL